VGGCGPFVRLEQTVFKGHEYEGSGWVNASPQTRLRLVLGSRAQDVAVAETVRGRPGWRRLAVPWIPAKSASQAVMAVQIMSVGTTTLRIDDFEFGPRAGGAGGVGVGRSSTAHYEVVVPATTASSLGHANTGAWAGAGAAAGLLVIALALAAARAAARRRADSTSPQQR
jgi:hypothetical protein